MVVEVPLGSFVKRELHLGSVDFVSPVPCPFNYGYVPDSVGADGDPMDALELGPRLGLGERIERPVVGVVRFLDGGVVDDKLILSTEIPTSTRLRFVVLFFRVYAYARAFVNGLKGVKGKTRFLGLERRV